MRLQECRKCLHHIKSIADCTLCRINREIDYRIIFQGDVISCPLDEKG